MIYEFEGFIPVVHPTAFVHPQAYVVGNVIIGKDVYIGPGAAIRGDWGQIIIEDGCNVQENCTIHIFPGGKCTLLAEAHIGHGAIVHGATIGKNTLIGMNAVVMDNCVVGDECVIGALTFIPTGTQVPNRSVMVGNPGKVIKQVSDEMLDWKIRGTRLYQQLPEDCRNTLKVCEPLTEIPADRAIQTANYKPWKS